MHSIHSRRVIRSLTLCLLVVLTVAELHATGPLRRLLRRKRCCCTSAAKTDTWENLFDGKSLGKWEKSNFGGEGEIEIKDGMIVMEMGYSMSGITYADDAFPKSNYEVELEAQRLDGIDFFCGLTFPVKEDHCSLIVGGWAGTVVGLSSIDDKDASRNDTTKLINFDDKRWYKIKVRVTDDRIQCWIDDKQIIDADIKGKKISIRDEMHPACPLGISTWETKAALRNIRMRKLD